MLEWKNLPNSPKKHGWAFYYWLKKNKDRPEVKINKDGSLNITIRALL